MKRTYEVCRTSDRRSIIMKRLPGKDSGFLKVAECTNHATAKILCTELNATPVQQKDSNQERVTRPDFGSDAKKRAVR